MLVIRLDATLIEAASPKAGAAGHYKGGFGFHPLTSWCDNIGDALAVMQRPGNAGSFTASDHLAVLAASFAQIPAPWRRDVLVSIDGAGASHEVIDYLTSLNTAPGHGRRGRRVEYSIGWPVDERTMTGIEQLRERDWSAALGADGEVDPAAQAAELTGILRHGPGGDRLAGWPTDMRLVARRTPRPATKPAKLGEHPDWEYGAFVTNTPTGQVQFLDARHRTQAHVEDRVKQFKACGARNLPSIDYDRNSAWLQLAALATSLTAWLRHLALDGEPAKASTKTLRLHAATHQFRRGLIGPRLAERHLLRRVDAAHRQRCQLVDPLIVVWAQCHAGSAQHEMPQRPRFWQGIRRGQGHGGKATTTVGHRARDHHFRVRRPGRPGAHRAARSLAWRRGGAHRRRGDLGESCRPAATPGPLPRTSRHHRDPGAGMCRHGGRTR